MKYRNILLRNLKAKIFNIKYTELRSTLKNNENRYRFLDLVRIVDQSILYAEKKVKEFLIEIGWDKIL